MMVFQRLPIRQLQYWVEPCKFDDANTFKRNGFRKKPAIGNEANHAKACKMIGGKIFRKNRRACIRLDYSCKQKCFWMALGRRALPKVTVKFS